MISTNKLAKTLSALALALAFSNAAQAAIIEYNYSNSDVFNTITAHFFIDDSKTSYNLTSGTFTFNGTTYTASSTDSKGFSDVASWSDHITTYAGYSYNLYSDDGANLTINNYTLNGSFEVINANFDSMITMDNVSIAGAGTLNRVTAGNTAAVPEPEAYAMMLAGLGLLGFTARRKQKSA